jgi:hypothetical protein
MIDGGKIEQVIMGFTPRHGLWFSKKEYQRCGLVIGFAISKYSVVCPSTLLISLILFVKLVKPSFFSKWSLQV